MEKMEGPRLLRLLPYEDPMLRVASKDVVFPLGVDDVQLVLDMKFSIEPDRLREADAPWPSAAGMAAVQWGAARRVFLVRVEGNVYEARFNPSYEPIGDDLVEAEEGCFSIPKARGIVQRWRRIRAKWQGESGVYHDEILEDWPARVFQHETDHTNGCLYDNESAGKCIRKFPLDKM